VTGIPGLALLGALLAGLAVALALPVRAPRLVTGQPDPGPAGPAVEGWLHRHRRWWTLLSGAGATILVGGQAGLVAGLVAAVAVWTVIGRAETPQVRRRREAVRRDLPHVVGLLAAGLHHGSSVPDAVELVCDALPGPAADRLTGAVARLRLGTPAGEVWSAVAGDPELAPLGRALARAHDAGTPVVGAVDALAAELAAAARAEVEDRARTVGVKAALPLGLCLLPAFLLVGIVPLVAGLAASLGL